MDNLAPVNLTCIHPIHDFLRYFPNISKAQCKKVIFYRKVTGRDHKTTRMCCACCRLRQLRVNPELVTCHWITSGDLTFAKCEYCNSSLEITRPIFECRDCVFSYLERAIYENSQGRDINNLTAFAFCRTHKQGLYT